MADKYDKDLMSILAHDLRTPISSARSFIDLAAQSGDINEKQAKFLERAITVLGRMEGLVNDVLEMSRLERDGDLTFELCDMRLLIGESVSLLEGYAMEKQVGIQTQIHKDLPQIPGEPNLLRQMISNLVGNAVKYNRESGTVWVEAADGGDVLQMTVRDNGLGIPENDLPRVFEPFFRSSDGKLRKIEGSGLGLAIVKTIVERHHGTITAESVFGEGTTFIVMLPK